MDRKNFMSALRAFQKQVPFKPFVVELVNGRKVVVAGGDDLLVQDGVAVGFGRDGAPVIFDHEGVVQISGLPPEPDRVTQARAEVRRLRNAEPFRPFVIELEGGRRVTVKRPEHVGFYPGNPDGTGGSATFHALGHDGLTLDGRFREVTRVYVLDEGADAPAVTTGPKAGP
jgi:hypothetical protein